MGLSVFEFNDPKSFDLPDWKMFACAAAGETGAFTSCRKISGVGLKIFCHLLSMTGPPQKWKVTTEVPVFDPLPGLNSHGLRERRGSRFTRVKLKR